MVTNEVAIYNSAREYNPFCGGWRDNKVRVVSGRTLGVHEMFTRILRILRFITAFKMTNMVV
jgi:hypothetical protein